jgi:D-sedoheptulose 7-phosphate isomerase
MNLIDRISHQFEDNMRASLEALELLAAPIAGAVELITASLLDSGKVLVCGSSGSAGDARRFAAQLVNGFELERPALAAMALSADSSSLAPVAGDPDTQGLVRPPDRRLRPARRHPADPVRQPRFGARARCHPQPPTSATCG